MATKAKGTTKKATSSAKRKRLVSQQEYQLLASETSEQLGKFATTINERILPVLDGLGALSNALRNSQIRLQSAVKNTDTQMAVLIRMSVLQLNNLATILNTLAEKEVVPLLTEERISRVFQDWEIFRARPDCSKLMQQWYMGEPIDKLPPVPEKDPAAQEGAEHGNDEQAGGQRDGQSGQATAQPTPAHAMSEVPDPHAAPHQPDDR